MYICDVFVANQSLNVNQLYSYRCEEYIERFRRVEVFFGRGKTSALVISCREVIDIGKEEEKLGFRLSRVLRVIDEEALISAEQYELALWLSKTTLSPFISCLNTMLPKTLRTSKNISNVKEINRIRVNRTDEEMTPRQKEVYASLKDGMTLSDARKISLSIVNRFIAKGIIEVYREEASYKGKDVVINDNFKELTPDQKKVYDALLETEKTVSLLFGVTGSGKTEVYLHLARKYISEGKEVLILVPEISLTPQMIERVKERFNEVIFYHSELSDQERYEQYKRVKEGQVKIVVGTRSAVFLPFNDLGLIIIDEEHDTSYKQDSSPCYHAKNVALKRALSFGAKLLLASATPSLDSYTRALKGDYELLRLKERINKCLPQVEMIDLITALKNKQSYIITDRLKDELQAVLDNNKQAIILLNRRGYSPIIKCSSCGTTLMCSDCDMPLNYHSDSRSLKCHQCGRNYRIPERCPKCGERSLIYYGFGTERVEEELHRLFPEARVERMDRDNVKKKGSHKLILDRFGRHEADILVGTQMIAKGLDYPDVTLVGILNADAGLAHQDYNAAKLCFDLLMQAAGRSGRSADEGKVLIQAFNPDHYVLKAVLNQDYDYFYNIEMNYRSKTSYPPYAHLLEIVVSDSNREHIDAALSFLSKRIEKLPYKHYRPAELNRIKGQERYRLLLSSKKLGELIDDTWDIINDYLSGKYAARIKVDIDPLYLE